jgi:hypothetical protein
MHLGYIFSALDKWNGCMDWKYGLGEHRPDGDTQRLPRRCMKYLS